MKLSEDYRDTIVNLADQSAYILVAKGCQNRFSGEGPPYMKL